MRPSSLLPLFAALAGAPLAAQEDSDLLAPSDYSQPSIGARAAEVVEAWNQWRRTNSGLEERAFRLPMAEARELIQRSLGDYLDFLDRRRAYSQAVAAYIEKLRAAPQPGLPLVSQPAVAQDQVLVLGVNLSCLQKKLDSLRGSREWLAIRRGMQADRDALLKLQGTLRPLTVAQDLSIGSSHEPSLMSSIGYRDSDRQLTEVLQRLWTRYYQVLVGGVEQHPQGSAPLVPIRASAPPAPRPPVLTGHNPVVGVWTYVEGSQQFNGVAEPRHVLLEIWIENGNLVGRYRAELPDFAGERKIDLRLRAAAGANQNPLTLLFQSLDPPATGEIIIEGAAAGAKELMLVRNVGGQGPIPRGRELLHRH